MFYCGLVRRFASVNSPKGRISLSVSVCCCRRIEQATLSANGLRGQLAYVAGKTVSLVNGRGGTRIEA